jgi:hypothetical protein
MKIQLITLHNSQIITIISKENFILIITIIIIIITIIVIMSLFSLSYGYGM